MYECKDCGRKATDEQIVNAAEKCKDLNAMMQGLTLWQCTSCRLKDVDARKAINEQIRAELEKLRGAVSANSLQLLPTEALINELFKRYPHAIVAFRTIPVEGVNDAMEGQYMKGDYRMCQGLAQGIIGKAEREIVASIDRRRSSEEREEKDNV